MMNSPKLFLIIGKTFSGKDTLLNSILSNEEFCEENNLERLVRYTTREKRENEIEGKEYHFITDDEYESRFMNNKNATITTFNMVTGVVHYVTDFSSLDPNKNYITAGDPESIEDYKSKIGSENLCVIYLIPPNWTILQRLNTRGTATNEMCKENSRRFFDDLRKFGLYSNSYLSRTNCIIILSENVYIFHKSTLFMIHRFIKENNFTSVILHSKKERSYINTDYTCGITPSINEILCGKIVICNGNITLDSENETYRGYVFTPIY